MARTQCPHCFEQIDLMVEARRTFHSRRCPQGKSAREKLGATLNHCYCKAGPELLDDPPVTTALCCKCGDMLKMKGR